MAEVAHDTSGPSPKPGDVAPQQASRPDSPDKGKFRVFISYSRRGDLEFADQLDAALNACGFECFIDRQAISGGEDWKRRLGNLICESDTVVFVLSPTSARSDICEWEAEEAHRLGKRILPVIWRPLEGVSPPKRLRERNYIFFYADPEAAPGAGFGTGLAKLIAALNTDFDWLREHTRYLQRAIEWDRGGRPANRLLSGDDIAEANAWAKRGPKSAPEPTPLQLDFIRASEEEAEARSSAQRKQLEAMAAAQAETLKKAEEAQRKRATMARIRNIALVAVSILALLAVWLGWRAEQQRATADHILADATDIIVEVQRQMNDDTKKKVVALFQMGANQGDVTSMANLGMIYARGLGVAQDYAKAREWYQTVADKGHVAGMANLGVIYARGLGVAQDYGKAREWYEKAADKGDATAMLGLGGLYESGRGVAQDYAKAREWYEKAADKGDASAMNSLGTLYARGLGVAEDYAKAREWFQKAADKGHWDAMFNLGVLYRNGAGVAQDYAKAREWFQKAADKDSTGEAMFNLGELYRDGSGVAQDYAKAREWYEKAADKDHAGAKVQLEQLPIHEAFGAGRYAEALQLQ